ncbi:polymorphic toxin type 17 domain-containing protein [Candidatus Odyssella acanthamoebae]|uniref:Novel toxin 17 domain-containing protein n=1 Tax=Candidatus Odyssella acanthamoebae TaxID=91604 RepID=A0A077AYW4_9PROT|nr:polymorphic toxin type 17 domain-containing protein [Candidatus Paracaedibacter acanthamoebae]AIK97194.1 hypothetical protein ID47_11330 [Candidatus Paracaedibacter acanthamoebae]
MLTTGTNKIFLGASGSYAQEAVYDWYQRQEIKKKRRFNKLSGFAKTRRLESKHTYQVARPCTTISTNKKEIDLYGGKGVSLRGSVLQGGKLTVEAKEGLIHLLTTMGMDCVEVKKSSKDPLWQSKSQSFEYHENRQQCQFHYDEAQGGIEFKTPEGIVVELVTEKHSKADGKKDKGRPREWQRLKDYSNLPGYEWMKLLDEREDVVRIYVDERHDSGHFAHQGMTAAAKIIITIIITLCTAGGGLASLGATGGTAAAGGAAASTVTFSSVVSSMAMGALQGGLAAASNQLMFSMIDNRLNMKNVSREMTSSSTLKSIGQSAMTAGLGKGLSYATGIPTTGLHGFEEQAWGNAITAAARLGTGLAFGEKPKDVLKSTVVNYAVDVASGTIANKIGDWRLEGLDPVVHKGVHALAGGSMQGLLTALLGGDRKEILKAMGGGAMGAVVAETVGEAKGLSDLENGDLHGGNFREESAKLSKLSSLLGQLGAELSGLDSLAALRAGENAVENNCLPLLAALASTGGGAAGGTAAATGVGSTLAYYGSAILAGIGLSYLADKLSENSMDAAPEGTGWVDEGVNTEEGKATILSTPIPAILSVLEGFTPPQFDRRYGDEGFQTYQGPDASVLTKDGEYSIKSRLKDAQLPTQGKIRFIPRKSYNPSKPLDRGDSYGYVDRFGNEWTKGPSRTEGQDFEWDIQLSRQGQSKIGWASRDNKHVNVSLDGKITHK